MTGIIGKQRSNHKRFKFVVEIDGVKCAGFEKCSELKAEVAVVEQHEGGAIIPNKSPGRMKFSDVTLERGASADSDLWDWFNEVARGASGLGDVDYSYKRGLDIVQQDRDGEELRRWRIFGAWPTAFVAGEWDNTSDENVIESITLTFDYFNMA